MREAKCFKFGKQINAGDYQPTHDGGHQRQNFQGCVTPCHFLKGDTMLVRYILWPCVCLSVSPFVRHKLELSTNTRHLYILNVVRTYVRLCAQKLTNSKINLPH